MPKVYSRAAISTSAQSTVSSAAALRVYYCICGEFILVIEKTLSSLPTRKTDGATIIRSQDCESEVAKIFKLNAVSADPVILERQEGYEKQYRFLCPRCSLPIGYQTTPPPVKNGPFLYIIRGSLTFSQARVPDDAFYGEELES